MHGVEKGHLFTRSVVEPIPQMVKEGTTAVVLRLPRIALHCARWKTNNVAQLADWRLHISLFKGGNNKMNAISRQAWEVATRLQVGNGAMWEKTGVSTHLIGSVDGREELDKGRNVQFLLQLDARQSRLNPTNKRTEFLIDCSDNCGAAVGATAVSTVVLGLVLLACTVDLRLLLPRFCLLRCALLWWALQDFAYLWMNHPATKTPPLEV